MAYESRPTHAHTRARLEDGTVNAAEVTIRALATVSTENPTVYIAGVSSRGQMNGGTNPRTPAAIQHALHCLRRSHAARWKCHAYPSNAPKNKASTRRCVG